MTQLGSKKSRKGCSQCKRRRVKCDENMPCANCVRRSEQCSLLYPTSPGVPSDTTVAAPDTQDWLQDLELMHHYSNRTSRSRLGASIRLQHVFTEQIPLEAAKHAFLMHGVLALSALHIACTRAPSQRAKYASLCDKHQASALASYRHILTHITDDVANALFALATILSMSSLARAILRAQEMPEPHYISVDGICELLYLTRGVREVKEATGDLINNGPFAVVLYGHEISADIQVTMSPTILGVFRDLDRMCVEHCADLLQRKECKAAVVHLQSIYETLLGLMSTGGVALETGHIWRWTALLSYDFIKLVQSEFPPALVITAHFAIACLMLRDLWYVGSWGNLAFDGIRVALKGQLDEYLIWAQEQINTECAGLKYGAAIVETTTPSWQDSYSVTGSQGATPLGQTPMVHTPFAE